MIPYLEALIEKVNTPEEKRSIIREYLQIRILESLQRAGAMIPLAFHGGTALRFLYQLPRYSEDLDFALERKHEQYNFREFLGLIQRDLSADTYVIDIKLNENRVVNSAFIRFRGLLYELGITPHIDEVLGIKVEIDTNPPAGATLATYLIRHHVDVNIQHHDQSSLLAGKLHAILQREYVKGRDWYDLYWYLRQPEWMEPNLDMLNAALIQSGWSKGRLEQSNWKQHVHDCLDSLAWQRVVEDVKRFIIDDDELALFTKESIRNLLQ